VSWLNHRLPIVPRIIKFRVTSTTYDVNYELVQTRYYLQCLCIVANRELVLAKGACLLLSIVLCTKRLLIWAFTDTALGI
jgi:hypothetical protein